MAAAVLEYLRTDSSLTGTVLTDLPIVEPPGLMILAVPELAPEETPESVGAYLDRFVRPLFNGAVPRRVTGTRHMAILVAEDEEESLVLDGARSLTVADFSSWIDTPSSGVRHFKGLARRVVQAYRRYRALGSNGHFDVYAHLFCRAPDEVLEAALALLAIGARAVVGVRPGCYICLRTLWARLGADERMSTLFSLLAMVCSDPIIGSVVSLRSAWPQLCFLARDVPTVGALNIDAILDQIRRVAVSYDTASPFDMYHYSCSAGALGMSVRWTDYDKCLVAAAQRLAVTICT